MADEPEAGRDDDAGGEGAAGDRERPERDEHGRSVPHDDGSEDGSSDGSGDESSVAGDGGEDDDAASSADGADAAGDAEETGDDAADEAEGADGENDADAEDETDAEGEAEETANETDADGDVTDSEVDDDGTDEGERSDRLRPASDDEKGGKERRDEDDEDDEDDEAVPENGESEDGDGESDSTDESDDHDDTDESDDEDEVGEADDERDDSDDTDDDPDFPVKGMSAEEATWDPEKATDAEELAVDEDAVEPTDDDADADVVGVQPEKQEIDDSFWGEGPESDREMPLADHIEEMMRRLGVVFLIGGTVTLVVLGLAQAVEWLPTAVDIIDALWNHNIPNAPEDAGRRPRVYGPLELILTKLKVAGLAGLLVGLPAFVYETYLFMRPGLYPRERKYYLAAVPTSLVLGVIGMTFAHFVVLPVIFDYFTTYTQETGVTVAFGLAETFNLIILLMGYMAIVFQIPLFIMLAIMMNLVTRLWLEDKRLLFWGAFAGLAFLASPDPTGMAPIIIAATMIVLYEGTLALLRWTGN